MTHHYDSLHYTLVGVVEQPFTHSHVPAGWVDCTDQLWLASLLRKRGGCRDARIHLVVQRRLELEHVDALRMTSSYRNCNRT